MTALLINVLPQVSAGPQPPVSPALADAEPVDGGGSKRFGEALRAHSAADDHAEQPQEFAGGLLASARGEPELSIDDGDILRQLAGSGATAGAVVRTRTLDSSADEASLDGSPTSDDTTPIPVSVVPVVPNVLLPNAPVSPGPAARASTLAKEGAVAPEATADAVSFISTGLPAGRMNRNPAAAATGTALAAGDVADFAAAAAGDLQPNPSTVGRAPSALASVNAANADQASAVLTSQSQSVLMAFTSATADSAATGAAISIDASSDAQSAPQARQALAQALGERLSVQLNRGSSQAVIRLDPPMMGTIEITIRHDAAGVQVHMSASHGDVLRQLHGIGNALSQDLVQRNHGDVTVHVSESSRDGEGRQRPRQGASENGDSRPGHALRAPDESERASAFALA